METKTNGNFTYFWVYDYYDAVNNCNLYGDKTASSSESGSSDDEPTDAPEGIDEPTENPSEGADATENPSEETPED